MVKCPEQLIKIIENNGEWFERTFVAAVRSDIKLFTKVKGIVCIQPGSKGKHENDFEEPFNNIIYAAIRDFNSMFDADPAAFNPIDAFWLTNWMIAQANKAEFVMTSEIPEILAYFNQYIASQTMSAHTIYFATIGISSYLKSKRAGKIVRQMSLSGANLDDLALMCEENVDIINNLDDASRIISDVPDRIQVQDIEMYDDPNKVFIESIDCDLPALNDAMGGGFRKKCAYMIIGGTGSGKTIIACQFACSFTYGNGANGLFISTEQQHDELYRRMVSNRCHIPHRIISKGIFRDKLTEREREAYTEFRKNVAELKKGSLRMANWGNFEKQAGDKIVKRIEEEIALYTTETGKKLDYIILDWIGGALGSMADAGDQTRHIYQEAADAMEETARKHNLVAITLAQAHVSSTNKVQITAADLSECKSMTRLYSGVIGISALYSEEYARQLNEEKNKKRKDYRVGSDLDDAVAYSLKQYLYVSKARHGVQKAVPFKREYEYQKMDAWS